MQFVKKYHKAIIVIGLLTILITGIGITQMFINTKSNTDNNQENSAQNYDTNQKDNNASCLITSCVENEELKNSDSANCYCEKILPKVNAITIDINNWQEYFEFEKIDIWDEDVFGEVTGLAIQNNLKLKDIYRDKIAEESVIKFKVSGRERSRLLNVDYKNKVYSLGNLDIYQIDRNHETTISISFKHNSDVRDFSEIIYWCHDGYYEQNNQKIMEIFVFEEYKVTRVEGILYLYD